MMQGFRSRPEHINLLNIIRSNAMAGIRTGHVRMQTRFSFFLGFQFVIDSFLVSTNTIMNCFIVN